MLHVAPVIVHRAVLVVVVVPGDRQDRDRDPRVVRGARPQRLPVVVGPRVLEHALEPGRGIPHHAVELAERPAGQVQLPKLRDPERRVAEEVRLGGDAAGVGGPLHEVGHVDVVLGREVHAHRRGGGGNDRRQMRREVLKRRPLVVAGVGAAPHRNLAVAPRLFGQPLDYVVAVPALVLEGQEHSFRITPAPDVYQREDVSVLREVAGARVVGVAVVRREREDHGQRFVLGRRLEYGGVQPHAVAQGNLHRPQEVDRRGGVRAGRSGRSGGQRGAQSDRQDGAELHREPMTTQPSTREVIL